MPEATADTANPNAALIYLIDAYKAQQSHISDREFERRAGLPSSRLSKIRKGERPTAETLKRIASTIGCTVGELLGEPAGRSDAPVDMRMIPLGLIDDDENPRQRGTGDDDGIYTLADSIMSKGLINPLLVRPKAGGRYSLIAGGRRRRAMHLLVTRRDWSLDEWVPCKVAEVDDRRARSLALIENIQRADMDPLDEGDAFKAMLKDGMETKDIAAAVHKDIRYVQQRLALTDKLPDAAKADLKAGKISVTQAREMISKPKAAKADGGERSSGKTKAGANPVRRAPEPGPIKAGRSYNPHPNAIKTDYEFTSLVTRGADGPMPVEITLWDPVGAHEARYIRADRVTQPLPVSGTVDDVPTVTQAAAMGIKPALRRPDLKQEPDLEDMPPDAIPDWLLRKKAAAAQDGQP